MRETLQRSGKPGIDGLDIALLRLNDHDAIKGLAREHVERRILARKAVGVVLDDNHHEGKVHLLREPMTASVSRSIAGRRKVGTTMTARGAVMPAPVPEARWRAADRSTFR